MANSNNLLNFVNNASSSIQDALGKPPKKKRVVNVRKFVQGRVKRLDNGSKPRPAIRQKANQLSSKPRPPPVRGSTWPDISICGIPPTSVVPALAEREVSTYSYPTTTMSTNICDLRSCSEPNLCLPPPSQPSHPIDPELESLLSSLTSPSVSLSRHGSFESIYTSTLSRPPSTGNSEAQVYVPEQAFSPYSDFSTDDLDSAYSSPIESVRLSYNCSPTGFSTVGTNGSTSSLPTWTTPLSCGSSTEWVPVASSNCMQEVAVISSACDWMSSDSLTMTTSSASSVYDQGPPMTPTVSQLLEQYNQY